MLTTRALMPWVLSISYASMQSATSLPGVSICENICSAPYDIGRGIFRSVQRRHRLPGQNQCDWFVPELRNDAPGLNRFIGIGWSQRDESRDRAQRRQMLH